MAKAVQRIDARWVILALLFLATVFNYVDRQALSILASRVQRDLKMDDLGYAHVVQCFLIAYTFSYLVSGWLTDKLGAKWMLALCLGWWSLANMATGWVRNTFELAVIRTLLGLGEPGVYTAGPKVIGQHFAPEQRGLAFGIYTAGAMVGATLAPPLIGGLALGFGWRTAFVATGALGLLWVLVWLFLYRSPPGQPEDRAPAPIPWRAILRDRTMWGFAAARMIADPVWYFYLFWFPKYLTDARGMSLLAVAQLAWTVYLASDLGSIGGGLFSSRLIKRGMAPIRARMTAIVIAAGLAPLGMLIAAGPGLPITLFLGAVVAFAHLVFQVNMGTLIVDLYPQRIVATVFGVIAAGSGLGGIFSTQFVGEFVGGGAYAAPFLIMGLLHPLACLVIWLSIRGAAPGRS